MNKKQDLKIVFEFIADFLREDIDNSPVKATSVVNRVTGETKSVAKTDGSKNNNEQLNRALEIMKKLGDIDIAKGDAVKRLKSDEQLKISLQRQLNELRNEHSMMISEDAIAEEKELDLTIPPIDVLKSKIELESTDKPKSLSEHVSDLGIKMEVIPGICIPEPMTRSTGKKKGKK